MSYLALYRKYRSKNFDEVYGQDSIVKTLKNALKNNKIAHAYLFSGPRGTGKTSIARLFAKALNCEKGLGEECNNCTNCLETIQGTHPDVIEIDAASNSGVDEVRNLIDKIKYAPIRGRYKVYIIDEVHMMSNSAFNALLKTLEEPPSYVVFILCTTELHKVLPTIISRCQRYEFKKLSDDALRALLINVLNKEGVSYTSGVIDLLIELANGGARDALSILDQLISFAGNNLIPENIEQLFGLSTIKDKISLLETIKNKDSLGLIKKYEDLISRNIDLVRFINELLLILKDALIYRETKEEKNMYTKIIASYFDSKKLISLISILLELQKEYKFTSNPSLITELYLLKMIKDNTKETKELNLEIIKEETKKPLIQEEKEIKKEIKEEPKIINEPVFKNNDLLSALEENNKEETPVIKNETRIEDLNPIFNEPFKKVSPKHLNASSNLYKLSDDDLINLTVLSNKDAKRQLVARWPLLAQQINNEDDARCITLLLEGRPYLLTSNLLVLCYSKESDAKIINTKEYQADFAKYVSKISGSELEIYAISLSESTNLITRYRNLNEIKKLPKATEIGRVTIKKED